MTVNEYLIFQSLATVTMSSSRTRGKLKALMMAKTPDLTSTLPRRWRCFVVEESVGVTSVPWAISPRSSSSSPTENDTFRACTILPHLGRAGFGIAPVLMWSHLAGMPAVNPDVYAVAASGAESPHVQPWGIQRRDSQPFWAFWCGTGTMVACHMMLQVLGIRTKDRVVVDFVACPGCSHAGGVAGGPRRWRLTIGLCQACKAWRGLTKHCQFDIRLPMGKEPLGRLEEG